MMAAAMPEALHEFNVVDDAPGYHISELPGVFADGLPRSRSDLSSGFYASELADPYATAVNDAMSGTHWSTARIWFTDGHLCIVSSACALTLCRTGILRRSDEQRCSLTLWRRNSVLYHPWVLIAADSGHVSNDIMVG